jgi:hypothetical protein
LSQRAGCSREQVLAFHEANRRVEDGFGCETMEIAIFEEKHASEAGLPI